MFLHSHSFMFIPVMVLIITLSTQRKHFLMILLTLEAITLTILAAFLMAPYSSSWTSAFISIFILTLAATEASLGLALLVVMSRQTGNDLMTSTTQLKC